MEGEIQNEIDIDILKPGYKLFEATSNQAEILNLKMDKFNGEQLLLAGEVGFGKNYLIKDSERSIIAGIKGWFYFGECLYINILFVDITERREGLGTILLKTMEQQAKSMNISLVHLDTFDFQAKDFYLKHGYEIFGVLDNCPKGHKRYYMKKIL